MKAKVGYPPKTDLYYDLVGTEVVPTSVPTSVGKRVMATTIRNADISTVFLGIDHGFCVGPATPILFETMVFEMSGSPFGSYFVDSQYRYADYRAAVSHHKQLVWGLKHAMLIDTT